MIKTIAFVYPQIIFLEMPIYESEGLTALRPGNQEVVRRARLSGGRRSGKPRLLTSPSGRSYRRSSSSGAIAMPASPYSCILPWPLQDIVSLRGCIAYCTIIFFANTPTPFIVQYIYIIARYNTTYCTPHPVLRCFEVFFGF